MAADQQLVGETERGQQRYKGMTNVRAAERAGPTVLTVMMCIKTDREAAIPRHTTGRTQGHTRPSSQPRPRRATRLRRHCLNPLSTSNPPDADLRDQPTCKYVYNSTTRAETFAPVRAPRGGQSPTALKPPHTWCMTHPHHMPARTRSCTGCCPPRRPTGRRPPPRGWPPRTPGTKPRTRRRRRPPRQSGRGEGRAPRSAGTPHVYSG